MFSYNKECHDNFTNSTISGYDTRRISPKKKKRKYSVDGLSATQNGTNNSQSSNFSISIIDRVLDLNKYDQNTGLYKLARDWINATTSISDSNKKVKMSDDNHGDKLMDVDIDMNGQKNEESSYFINNLPNPLVDEKKPSIAVLNENIKLNIRSSENSDIDLIKTLNINEDDSIQTHALLKLHMNRWKSARKEWINFYNETNRPYKNSLTILNSIIEDM